MHIHITKLDCSCAGKKAAFVQVHLCFYEWVSLLVVEKVVQNVGTLSAALDE